jgi:hypothetical protein
MPRAWSHISLRDARGFSAVEVLLAATVFGMLVTGLIGAFVYGRTSTAGAGERVRATLLAEEGTEAVRNIRDAAFANLVDGTYYLAQSGSVWTLTATPNTSGIFTRQVVIATVDGVRKSATVNVSWSLGNGTSTVSSTTRLTNWLAVIATTTWPNAVLSGSLDLAGTNDGVKVATVGNYAYIVRSNTTANFAVVDISGVSPTLVGTANITGTPSNVAMSSDGNTAYVSTNSTTGELVILNTTTKASPAITKTFDVTGTTAARGLSVVGTTVYLVRTASATASNPEFVIINAATPSAPTIVGSYNNDSATMYEVWVSGSNAYVASSIDAGELLVISFTTPSAPTLLKQFDLTSGGTTDAITITGTGTTLVMGQGVNIVTINIATPATPVFLDTTLSTSSATVNDLDIDSTGHYAFVATATTTAEFEVLDMTDPASTSIVRNVDLAGTTSTLAGVAYNTSLDIVVGTSISDTLEALIFKKN